MMPKLTRYGTIVTAMVLVALAGGLAFGKTTGKNGYIAKSQIDTNDVDALTVDGTRKLGVGGGPSLGAASDGTVYLVAGTIVSSDNMYQEVLSFAPGLGAAASLKHLFRVKMVDAWIRSLMVVPANTSDANGDAVLVKDQLLLIVDGYDTVQAQSWREFWLVDPAAPDAPVVLFRHAPEPTRYPTSAGGEVNATVSAEGVIYYVEEGDPNAVSRGGIRAFAWDDGGGAYLEAGSPLTTGGTVVGPIVAGPDGYIYAFEDRKADPNQESTDRVIRIDPTGTDVWTKYRRFKKKLRGSDGFRLDLAFDSNGDLFMSTRVKNAKGQNIGVILPVTSVTKVGGRRIAKTGTTTSLLRRNFVGGPGGTLYVIENLKNRTAPQPDLDAVVEIAPGS